MPMKAVSRFFVAFSLSIGLTRAAAGDWRSSLKLDPHSEIVEKSWAANSNHGLAAVIGPNRLVKIVVIKNGALVAQSNLAHDCSTVSANKHPAEMDGVAPCGHFKFDLAAYKLKDGDVAFGLRWTEHSTFPAGESETDHLALFELSGLVVRQILNTKMVYSDIQRGQGDSNDSNCLIKVLGTSTLGYHDFEKSCRSKTTELGKLDQTRRSRHSTTIIRWDGQTYVEPGVKR